MKRRNIIFGLCLVLLTDIAAQSAWAQNGERFRERQAARRQAAGQRREGGPAEKRQQNGRGLVGLPPKWVQNLRDMPPEEQEKFMQNNERFQSLPPWRQQQIRQNLQKWNSLSLEQQDRIRKTQQFLDKRHARAARSLRKRHCAEAGADGAGTPRAGAESLAQAPGPRSRRAAGGFARSCFHGEPQPGGTIRRPRLEFDGRPAPAVVFEPFHNFPPREMSCCAC